MRIGRLTPVLAALVLLALLPGNALAGYVFASLAANFALDATSNPQATLSFDLNAVSTTSSASLIDNGFTYASTTGTLDTAQALSNNAPAVPENNFQPALVGDFGSRADELSTNPTHPPSPEVIETHGAVVSEQSLGHGLTPVGHKFEAIATWSQTVPFHLSAPNNVNLILNVHNTTASYNVSDINPPPGNSPESGTATTSFSATIRNSSGGLIFAWTPAELNDSSGGLYNLSTTTQGLGSGGYTLQLHRQPTPL